MSVGTVRIDAYVRHLQVPLHGSRDSLWRARRGLRNTGRFLPSPWLRRPPWTRACRLLKSGPLRGWPVGHSLRFQRLRGPGSRYITAGSGPRSARHRSSRRGAGRPRPVPGQQSPFAGRDPPGRARWCLLQSGDPTPSSAGLLSDPVSLSLMGSSLVSSLWSMA